MATSLIEYQRHASGDHLTVSVRRNLSWDVDIVLISHYYLFPSSRPPCCVTNETVLERNLSELVFWMQAMFLDAVKMQNRMLKTFGNIWNKKLKFCLQNFHELFCFFIKLTNIQKISLSFECLKMLINVEWTN